MTLDDYLTIINLEVYKKGDVFMTDKNYQLDSSLIYEFLLSIFRLENNDIIKAECSEFEKDIKINKEINNWAKKTLKTIPKNQKLIMNKYFNQDSYFALCLISEIPYLKLESIQEYLNYLKEKEEASFLKKFTESGYGVNLSERLKLENVKGLIANEKNAANFVDEKINLAAEQKWNLLQFYFNPKKMKLEFLEFLEWYYENIFKKNSNWINEKLTKINENYAENLKRYGKKYIESILGKVIDNPLDAENNYLVFSYFYEISFLNSISENGDNFYLIGFRFPEVFAGSKEGLLGSLEIFKVLADETRLNIISLLADKTMYGNELAEKLNLTNATISHHMSKLLMYDIIKANKENNKLYFKLNKKSFKKIISNSVENLL